MKHLIFILSLILLQACSCRDIECTSPHPEFNFDLVDAQTGNNIFTSGQYTTDALKVKNQNNQNVDFILSEDPQRQNIIILQGLGWQTEKTTVSFYLNNTKVFDFYVDAERTFEDCCEFTRIHEQKVLNATDSYWDSQRFCYVIKL